MESVDDKIKKHRAINARTSKPCCGTLKYIAECRGIRKKTGSGRWPAVLDPMNNFDRKSAAL